jgi:hypothetical protein
MVKASDICRLHPNDREGSSSLKLTILIVVMVCVSTLAAAAGKIGQLTQLSSSHSGHSLVARTHSKTGLASTGLWDR